MNRKIVVIFVFLIGLSGTAGAQETSLKPGGTAPDFTATDSNGKSQSLSASKGRFVVLEWFNEGCPFIQKHYLTGNMQKLQKEFVKKGIVWFSVISSAPGRQGHSSSKQANTTRRVWEIASTATILDPEGKVGHLYGAKTPPHMFVFNPEGKIAYMGAIDDKRSVDPEDVKSAKNYVRAALEESMAGKPVTTPATEPYGCSVKY